MLSIIIQYLNKLIFYIKEFCKAPKDQQPINIPVKQLGCGNRTYHIIVHRKVS